MNNLVADSPVSLVTDPSFWSRVPEVPFAVDTGFGKGEAVLHQKIWRGLVEREGKQVFAWVEGNKLMATAMTDARRNGQSLESDAAGRALVIGADSRSLFAVERSGAARCLGVLGEGTIRVAGWLPDGGVVAVIDEDLCVYGPADADADAVLQPRLRIASNWRHLAGIRSLPSPDPAVLILTGFAFDIGMILAIGPDERVRVLADFEGLGSADIRVCLDETGMRTALPSGPSVSIDGGLARVEGLDAALASLDRFPELETQAPPTLAASANPQPSASVGEVIRAEPKPVADASVPPDLIRLPPLSAALIKLLRDAPQRSEPDPRVLALIREGMPIDLRAYVHAWACYDPNNPTVYEFWMAAPRVEDRAWIREHAGDCLAIGSFASGEPILARHGGGAETQIVMIDEEGQPYRYRGFEGFLADLKMRSPDDSEFELDAYL